MSMLDFGKKFIPIKIQSIDIDEFSIVCPSKSGGLGPMETPANVMKAAQQLQHYIAKISGISLPVVSDRNPLVKEYEILVGETIRPESATIYSNIKCADEYYLKTVGSKLVIGGGKRGILYGVYSLLEKYFGVRFFTKDVEKIYDAESIEINQVDDHFTPPFEYREISYWNAWDPEFSVKMKINGAFVRQLRDEDGGGMGYAGEHKGLVHTFSHLLPAQEFFADHPEYYALNEKGVRDPSGLCLSNPKVFSNVLKNAKKWLRDSKIKDILSVSINDGNVAYCNCEKCRKIREKEGGVSGNVLRFVNKIAKALSREFPDVLVDTIIYGEVLEVPKITRPRENVIVRVCGWTTRSHSIADYGKNPLLDECDDMKRFRRLLDDWSKVCKKIYVWDYPAQYYQINTIFPHFHTLLKNKKYFLEHNVKGIFINGNSDHCQFSELSVYLLAKILWNPTISEEEYDALINEFLQGYYGKGWKFIRQFMDETAKITKKKTFQCFSYPAEILPVHRTSDGKIDLKWIEKLKSYFSKAEQLATQGEKYRIRKAALQVDYYEMYATMDERYKNGDSEVKKELVEKNKKLYDDLKKFSILRVVENCFLPVVKDFRQSPVEWSYWDQKCLWGDKNNENYSRNIYGMLETDENIGETVNISFLFRTSNINSACFGRALGKDGMTYICDEEGKKLPLVWDNFHDYKRVEIKNAVVTNLKTFAAAEGKKEDTYEYMFLPAYKKGVIFCMEGIDAGAYYMIKDLQVERK